MARKHIVCCMMIAAICWTAVYIVALMWVTEGWTAGGYYHLKILVVGTMFVGYFSACTVAIVWWVIDE